MSNPWGRLNAPMEQPTKDELREIIRSRDDEIAKLKSSRKLPPAVLVALGIQPPARIRRR